MLREPALSREQIVADLGSTYGLRDASLQFIPVGMAAACYVVAPTGGPRCLLKLWPDDALGHQFADDLAPVLTFLVRLSDRLQTAQVLAPIATLEGELQGTVARLTSVLFPYVEGRIPEDSPTTWGRVADILAELHSLDPAIGAELRHDRFDVGFIPAMRRDLEDLDAVRRGDNASRRAVRELVLPRRNSVLEQLFRLEGLHRELVSRTSPTVICHSDLLGDNLVIDDAGTITALDWDSACLACPEADLWPIDRVDADPFLDSYAAVGASDVDLARLEFYLLRRPVEDMRVRLHRLLHEQRDGDEIADALDGIDRWGFVRWERLEENLALARQVLARRAG